MDDKHYQWSFIYRCKHSTQDRNIATKIWNSNGRYNLPHRVEHRYYNMSDGQRIRVIYHCKECLEEKKKCSI